MTLQEAKDQIKAKYNVDDLFRKELDEVAELYARSKCEEAIYAYLSYPQNSLLDINKVLPQILRHLFEEQDITSK